MIVTQQFRGHQLPTRLPNKITGLLFDCYTHLTRRAEDQPRNLGLVTCHDRTSVSNHRIIRIK
ncbi:hypothetical protein NC651_025329 [Populus alba x Populus x berolinensis]|nr:hypothetical protein NC651_025329 [Populus alba x Populus x berolinensis]